jgi:hypothetical protein
MLYYEYAAGGNGERVLGFAMLPLDKSFEQEVADNENYIEDLKVIKSLQDINFLIF